MPQIGCLCTTSVPNRSASFPRSDSTWPWSQELLAKHTAHLTQEEKDWILHDNVAELYGLP